MGKKAVDIQGKSVNEYSSDSGFMDLADVRGVMTATLRFERR